MPLSKDENVLLALKSELEFLEKGSYREPLVWRSTLIFEDSPICAAGGDGCADASGCLLRRFVPTECQECQVPCRHIPLNDKGETVDSLYRMGTHEELEAALRSWLQAKIKELGG
ncbi:MAG TPA: hypothetical protein VF753_05990 [Terriglobales bacterium]